jgi:uncharacterized membrane protein YfcA
MGTWVWPVALFALSLAVGVVAPVAGVGGGVLFVPLVRAFFPFHIGFISGAGLIIALTSAVSSSPRLLRRGLANLRAVIPIALVSVSTAILGGFAHLWITRTFPRGEHVITIALGAVLVVVFSVMTATSQVESPTPPAAGGLADRLKLAGVLIGSERGERIPYRLGRLGLGLTSFAVVGFIGGMFGLGSGWANGPVLNLVMLAPIKVAAASSMSLITINSAAAAWVYWANGAVLPLIVLPGVLGMAIGSRIGARLAASARPRVVRRLIMGVLLLAGGMNLFKGLAGLGILPDVFP